MSHLNFLAFSTNFCFIKTYLSGNSVWPQASGFQKLAKLSIFGIFNELLSTKNVNVARFARNVEWDFEFSRLNTKNVILQTFFLTNFRNGSGSSAGTANSRDASPTYQNWSQNNNINKDESKNSKGGSDCTSSTECSEDSDRNSDNSAAGGHTNPEKKPTPAPRTTLDNSSVSSKNIVSLVKQVRHESLVWIEIMTNKIL